MEECLCFWNYYLFITAFMWLVNVPDLRKSTEKIEKQNSPYPVRTANSPVILIGIQENITPRNAKG